MENIVGYNNNLLVKWRLLGNDGSPFPVDCYFCKVLVGTGVGRTEVKSFSVTGEDKNIVSWEMNMAGFRFIGSGSLWMDIYRKGLRVASVEYRDAFRIVKGGATSCDCVQTLSLTSFVNVLHPDKVEGSVNVLFPHLEVGDDMHLHLVSDTELYNSNFELADNGHLIFKND